MNILLLNGSPRAAGNTAALLGEIQRGIQEKGEHSVRCVDVTRLNIKPCIACNYCQKREGTCVHRDDCPALLEQFREADCIIFGSPVYWWNISAQLKLFIDRLYADMGGINGKKIGVVAVGVEALDDPEYRLIREQFECIANHLQWDLLFSAFASAYEAGAVREDAGTMERFHQLGLSL